MIRALSPLFTAAIVAAASAAVAAPTEEATTVLAGGSAEIVWTASPEAARYNVELSRADDPEFAQPTRRYDARWSSLELSDVPAGIYRARAIAVNGNGERGASADAGWIVALPAAIDAHGEPIVRTGDRLRLGGPGTMRLPAPDGATLAIDGAGGDTLRFSALGLHRVRYRATPVGGPTLRSSFLVHVATPRIIVPALQAVYDDDRSTTIVPFMVVGAHGEAVDGLFFSARATGFAVDPIRREALGLDREQRKTLSRCRCTRGGTPVKALGEGRYVFEATHPARGGYAAYDIVESGTGTKVAIVVPIADHSPNVPSASISIEDHPGGVTAAGAYARVNAGAHFGTQAFSTFNVGGEVGGRFHLDGPVHLDVGATASWSERGLAQEGLRAAVIPIQMRAAVGGTFGILRPYVGGGVGVALVDLPAGMASDVPVHPSWSGFAGLGLAFGPGELVIEGSVDGLEVGDANGGHLLGIGMTVGYRLSPNLV